MQYRLGQQAAEQWRQVEPLVKLQLLKQVVERRAVTEGDDAGVEGRWIVVAGAAETGAIAQRYTAAVTGAGVMGEVGQTAGAEIAPSDTGLTAEGAAGRVERLLPRYEPVVNLEHPVQLTAHP